MTTKRSKPIKLLIFIALHLILNLNHTYGQTVGDFGTISSGNWSNTAIWKKWNGTAFATNTSTLPTGSDNVYICNGATVVLNQNGNCKNLFIGFNATNGVLQFENAATRTLNINGDFNININSKIEVINGANATHSVNIKGNLVNNGAIDLWMSSGGLTSSANLTFNGTTDNTISFGTGSLTNLSTININKTGATTEMLLDNTSLKIQNATNQSFINLQDGCFKLSGACTNFAALPFSNPVLTSNSLPATAQFWLNNPNVEMTGQASNFTLTGTIRMSKGTMTVGSVDGNALLLKSGATLTLDGGCLNIASLLRPSNLTTPPPITFNMSGGTINVCTIGNSTGTTSFYMPATNNTVNISGGTINLMQKCGTGLDYNVQASTTQVTGGVLNVGSTGSNAGFRLSGIIPNLVVGTNAHPQTAIAGSNCSVYGDISINNGSTLDFNAYKISLKGNASQNINCTGNIIATNYSSSLSLEKATGDVYLNCPLHIVGLNLNGGIIHSSTCNLLIVDGQIIGGSPSSYINGPVKKKIEAQVIPSLNLPIGKSSFQGIELFNLTATNAGYLTAEVFETTPNGSGGTGLTDPLTADRFWMLKSDENLTVSTIGSIKLHHSLINSNDVIGQSTSQTGSYSTIGGTIDGTTIQSNKPLNSINPNTNIYYVISNAMTLSGNYWIGENQPNLHGNRGFYNLTDFANALSLYKVVGKMNVFLANDYDGTTANLSHPETFPITFPAYPNSSASNTITIQLDNSVVGRETSNGTASPNTSLIYLAGANNIIFDGQGKDASGTPTGTNEWTIKTQNNLNNVPVFLLDQDASGNQWTNLMIEGNSTSSSNGTITFGSSSLTNGCSNNTIINCDIRNRSDLIEYPTNAIYSKGASSSITNAGNQIKGCKIYNFGNDNSISTGILLDANNDGWSIQNNSLYQSNALTASSGAIDLTGIKILAGLNHDISGNYIGCDNASCAGLNPLTIKNPIFSNSFTGILISGGSANINDNTISKIKLESNQSDQSGKGAFCGIYTSGSSNVNIGTGQGNTIGSLTKADEIVLDIRDKAYSFGINNTSKGNINIQNNKIGGITYPNPSPTITTNLFVIRSTDGTTTISNNIIGGSNSSSIYFGSNNGNGKIIAIDCESDKTNAIENNLIRNINSQSTGSASVLKGIYAANRGTNIIKNNQIYNFSIANTNTGTGSDAALIGIGLDASSATNAQNIAGNLVYAMNSSNAGSIAGIYAAVPKTNISIIKQNQVHSFKSTSNTSSQTGISIETGSMSCQNNMIRLGIDASGENSSSASMITGIYAGSSDDCSFYYNSVYLGGNGIASLLGKNTFAFLKTQSSADDIRNNIFCNARSSATNNGSKHYAYKLAYYNTGILSDYNIYQASGNEGVLFNVNSNHSDFNQIRLLRSQVKNQDLHSGVGEPYFQNPTGNSSNLSLKLSTSHPTPAKGTGIIVKAINEDIDGTSDRAGATGSATEIGADADPASLYTMDNSVDIFSPVFEYTPLGNCSTNPGNRTIAVKITDQAPNIGGIDPAHPPVVFYRRSAPSSRIQNWDASRSATGILQTGDRRNGTWRFTIDETNLSPQAENDIIEYYFTAQDLSNFNSNVNIAYSQFDDIEPVHATASTPITFPNHTAVDHYGILGNLPNNITIGSGGTFPSLTNSGGLFQSMNALNMTHNITATIISDITEDGTYELHARNEIPTGSQFSFNIVSDGIAERTLSQNDLYNKDMIRLDGSERLTIDGLYNGNKMIKFKSKKENYAVFKFLNDAKNNKLQNITIQGNTAQIPKGLIWFDTGTNCGNELNTICNTSISGSASTYGNAIFSLGSSGAAANSKNVIESNEMSNFIQNGIFLHQDGNGDAWEICNNSFFYNQPEIPTPINNIITGINIGAGGGMKVSGNYIGGQSAKCNGSQWTYNANIGFRGIDYNGSGTALSSICKNIIQNINLPNSGTNTSSFYGIHLENAPLAEVSGNMIGGTKNISTNNRGIYGLWINSPSTGISINDNSISNITSNYTGNASMSGLMLSLEKSAASLVQGNMIQNIDLSGCTGLYGFSGIEVTDGMIDTGTGNMIGDLQQAKSIQFNGNANFNGILINNSASNGNIIRNNTIANIFSNANQAHCGISLRVGTSAASSLTKNTITAIDIENTETNTNFTGIKISGLANVSQNIIGGESGAITSKGAGANFGIYSNAALGSLTNNTISNIAISGNKAENTAGNNLLTGIYLTGGTATANIIYKLNTSSTSAQTHLAGIAVNSTSGECSISGNRIYQLSNASTKPAASVNGVLLNPSLNNILLANNFITIGKGYNSPLFNGVLINQQANSKANIWFNSIVMDGTGDLLSSSAIQRENITTQIIIENNILINKRENASAFVLSNSSATNWISDYNDLFQQAHSIKNNWLGISYNDLLSWQNVTHQDNNSINYQAVFSNADPIGNCDFHLDPSKNCSLNGMGKSEAIKIDYDGEIRNDKRPDIGADEFIASGGNETSDIWTGLKNENWDEAENWSCQLIPLPTTDVTIPIVGSDRFYPSKNTLISGSYETVDADCHHLNLKQGASLKIQPNESLTIGGNFIVDGDFTIQSNAIGTGSFICRGTTNCGTTGSIKMERYFEAEAWHYFSPTTNKTNSSQFTSNNSHYNANLITYNEAWNADTDANGCIDYMDGWLFAFPKTAPSVNLLPTQAYANYPENECTIVMTGDSLNNGMYTVPISNTDASGNGTQTHGFNLVGNPYPSALNANDFIDGNASQIDGALYFWGEAGKGGWDISGSDYAVWSKMGTINTRHASGSGKYIPDGHIAPGQGFFVKKTNQGSGYINFSNSMREQWGTHFFKSKNKLSKVKIGVSSPMKHYNETMIVLNPEYDENEGMKNQISKIKGNTNLSFFSLLNKKQLAIQNIKLTDPTAKTGTIVPLGIEQKTSGIYEFEVEQFENIDTNLPVYFVDKQKNKQIKLNRADTVFYKTSLSAGVYLDRFELVFSSKPETETIATNGNINIKTQGLNIQIDIELATPNVIKGNYRIYDELGRLIAHNMAENNNSYTVPLPSTGMYLVLLEIGNEIIRKKILVFQ